MTNPDERRHGRVIRKHFALSSHPRASDMNINVENHSAAASVAVAVVDEGASELYA